MITSTNLNYLLVILGAVCFLLPSTDIIQTKRKRGGTVSKKSKWMIVVSMILVIVGLWNTRVLKNEKVKNDKAIRQDLTDSFNTALEKYDLAYSRSSRRIERMMLPV